MALHRCRGSRAHDGFRPGPWCTARTAAWWILHILVGASISISAGGGSTTSDGVGWSVDHALATTSADAEVEAAEIADVGDALPYAVDGSTRSAREADVRLLAGYWQVVLNALGGRENQTRAMRYRPWGFEVGSELSFDEGAGGRVDDPGPYTGWDVLVTRDHRYANVTYPAMDFVFLRLTRDATVAVVWYGQPLDVPAWLRAWERGGDVVVDGVQRATYRKQLPQGEHHLGTTEGRDVTMYTVLLSEASGQPSPIPAWPVAWGERISPNTPIPRDHILHNSHFAEGPDGHTYATWHGQIDPVYWAYFEHDHGSDPRRFAGFPVTQPVWAYTDPRIENDGFFGFKVIVADLTADDGRELSLMITAHLDNLTRRRLCERFHTLDIAVADKATGETLVRTHMLADTGFPRAAGLETRVRPPECPHVGDLDERATDGRRNLNVDDPGAYESWQYDLEYASALPYVGGLVILQETPLTVIGSERDAAGTYTAERLVYGATPAMGTGRHFQFSGARFGIDARSGPSGNFCTDRYARVTVPCDTEGALRQYIEPGFHFTVSPEGDLPRWGVDDPWVAVYTPKSLKDRRNGAVINVWRNLEHAIQLPN